MPFSSDSEAFESADEDIVEEKTKPGVPASSKIIASKPKKVEAAVDTAKQIRKEDSRFPVSGRSSPVKSLASAVKEDDTSCFPLSGRSSPVRVKPEEIPDAVAAAKLLMTELKQSKDVVKQEHDEITDKTSTQAVLTSKAKVLETTKGEIVKEASAEDVKPKVTETDDNAGWEFDDWADDTDLPKSTTADPETKKPTEDDEEVGWEVDDWGDEPIASTNSSFPVQSAKKESPLSRNLLGNISQMLISSDEAVKKHYEQKNDNTSAPPVNPLDRLTDTAADSSSNWGWKPWGGVVNLLSTASDGVASITSHVSSVIESGMGVPDPAEMARIQQQERQKSLQEDTPSGSVDISNETSSQSSRGDDASLLLGQFMSGMTQISSRVITGGLDTLEGIGKKTMTILKENDQGLLSKQRKIMMFDGKGPGLSQILREAKEKTEEAEKNLQLVQKQQYKKQLHFETLFDDYHGLVHLEALEMLSRQSALKLQSLIAPLAGRALDDVQETLNEVKELCELPENDSEDSDGTHTVEDLDQKIREALEDLDVVIEFKEFLDCWKHNADWLQDDKEPREPQAIHDKSLRCLAETSAHAVHKMHKLAELLLIKDRHSTANEADSLVQLTSTFCWHLSGISARFGAALSQLNNDEETNALITSTFLEGSNSISYIQNAFQLFIPILQIGAA